ncbi:MAG TPA: RNA polymerase sigma factor [Ktedonobacterales bacterium]|jgi:RNA polymerase sigma-70 factor, ECF subfamily|nr:RNA polymerase sigma factor [Ktedonobacterales bacterium]
MALVWPGKSCVRRGRWRLLVVCLALAAGQHTRKARQEHDTSAAAAVEASFDALFAEYERHVFGYLWRITGDQHLASDLCQETFLRAWQNMEKIRTYESPLGWLLRVATNLALNAHRRRDTRVGEPVRLSEELSPATSDPAWHVTERDAVHQILLSLSPNMRAALVLREVYGLSFAEVAHTLGITHAAAKMTLSRAREQFRRRYRQEEGQP